jgi:hypothetical protein
LGIRWDMRAYFSSIRGWGRSIDSRWMHMHMHMLITHKLGGTSADVPWAGMLERCAQTGRLPGDGFFQQTVSSGPTFQWDVENQLFSSSQVCGLLMK